MSEVNGLQIERAILSKILKDPDSIYEITDRILPKHFSATQHQLIFQAMVDLLDDKAQPSYLIVKTKLDVNLEKVGGEAYLKELYDMEIANDDLKDLADVLLKDHMIKSAAMLGYSLGKISKHDRDTVESQLSEVSQQIDSLLMGTSGTHTETIQDVLRDEWEQFVNLTKNPGITGVSTGLPNLDLFLSGYNPGSLITIAARTSVGKSAMSTFQMLKIAEQNIPVLMFSFEMPKKEISQRLVSMDSGIKLTNMRTGAITDVELETIKQSYQKISNYPIYIDTNTGASLSYVLSTIRRYVRTLGVKVVFVDYVQMMARNSNDLVREIGKVTRAFKAIAMELDITLVQLSQVNRGVESRENKRAELFDIRDSGNIEDDSDIVMILYRPSLYAKVKEDEEFAFEIMVKKHRQGPLGNIVTYFDKETVSFYSTLMDFVASKRKK